MSGERERENVIGGLEKKGVIGDLIQKSKNLVSDKKIANLNKQNTIDFCKCITDE